MSSVVHSCAYFASIGLKEKLPDWIEDILKDNQDRSTEHKNVGDQCQDNFNLLNTLSFLLQIGKKHLEYANCKKEVVLHTLLQYMPRLVLILPLKDSPRSDCFGHFTEGGVDTQSFVPNREMF